MYTARRATGTRPRRRFVALPLVLLAALAAILPATADDMQNGWLSVSIEPAIGAAISVDGVVRNTGAISRLELPPGDHWVDFGQVDGFMPPAPQQVRVARNETTELQVEYQPAGVLDVTVTPDGIDPLVSVDGVPRDMMGTTITVATGETTICGEPMTGYLSPGCQTVEVSTGVTTRVRLAYQSTPTDDEVVAGGPRVAEGLVGLYEFDDGSDDTITDTAGVVDGMDLTIADPSATTWGQGTLTFDQPTIATTGGAPTGLYQRVQTTGEFTVEAWIEPANLTQNGPARILSLGKDTSNANVVVGQGSHQGAADLIEARHQRTGDYQLPTAEGTLTTDLTHVVVTRAGDGTVTVYIDGQKQASRTLDGDPANWDTSHRLALGAELDKSRHWLGTYHLVALYDTALTPDQITTNHTAGPTGDTPQPEPEPEVEPDPVDDSKPPQSIFEMGAPLGTTTRISQHGITWNFSGEHEYGTYANGDYWVIGPVQIEEITPNSVSGGRHMNGSMINPSPRHGSGVGYDSDIRDVGYDATRNVALDVSPSNPLTVETHSSLVSTISVPEANARPGIETAAVLTVVDQAPADGSFRPPYSGDDKSARFTIHQLSRDLLPQLPTVAGTPDPTALAGDFERVWLDHVPGWTGRSIHPASNMPDYGRLMSASLGRGYLTLLLDFTPQEKQQLLINLVQVGIDFYGIVEDGGERNWVPNGGHAQGRKLPILFAGIALGDSTMASIGQREDVFFGEDAQTFYVDDNTLRVGTGYDSSHRGMPEWGIRHATDPSRDDVDWQARYRRDSTANSWHSHVLAARILGLQGAWNHDALFDYTDRYMDTEEPGQWFRSWDRPFSEAMWDTYRSQY